MKQTVACLVIFGAFAEAAYWMSRPKSPVDQSAVVATSSVGDMAVTSDRVTHVVAKPAPAVATDQPGFDLTERRYDFGVVDPLRTHRHMFEIRNAGAAPLTLKANGATCKCLSLDVHDEVVPPGGIGKVEIIWEAQDSYDALRQRVSLVTNDPNARIVDLEITGKTRLVLAAEPPALSAPRIRPDEKTELATTIVSRVWDAFTIEGLQSTLEGVEWSLTPADPNQLKKYEAKSGWRLVVTLPADLPTGSFRETLKFAAVPQAKGSDGQTIDPAFEPLVREIPLEGSVTGRLSVYGKDMRSWGIIEAGTIDWQRGYQNELLIKVNDADRELVTTHTETFPEFVEAKLEPHAAAGKPGLYRLKLRIPPDGRPGAYQGDRQGKITISFDHPRIKSLELPIEFVLVKSSYRRLSASHRVGSGGS